MRYKKHHRRGKRRTKNRRVYYVSRGGIRL